MEFISTKHYNRQPHIFSGQGWSVALSRDHSKVCSARNCSHSKKSAKYPRTNAKNRSGNLKTLKKIQSQMYKLASPGIETLKITIIVTPLEQLAYWNLCKKYRLEHAGNCYALNAEGEIKTGKRESYVGFHNSYKPCYSSRQTWHHCKKRDDSHLDCRYSSVWW